MKGYHREAWLLLHFCITDSKGEVDSLAQTTEKYITTPEMSHNNTSPPSKVKILLNLHQ